MKFTINNRTYFVKWDYIPISKKNTTYCNIYDTNTSYDQPLVRGVAFCSVTDKFCKNTGRKVSLDRALHNASDLFSYEDRKVIWQEYFKESPKRLR